MSLRSHIAIAAGKSAQWILKTFFKGGSSYPGKLALKIDPNVLDHYSDLYEVVVVTGTNGKTLTTALTVNILKQQYEEVLTNPTGANMVQGIVSTFLGAKPKKNQKNFAVLEIDEASLSKVTEYIKPELFVFTNIFRDQMDRYGEIYTTYRLIVEGAAKAPEALILANGDSPIFNSLDTVNPRKYYGFDHLPDQEQLAHYNTDGVLCPKCHHILHYQMITYANLGKYYCPNCGFHRPELDYKLTAVTHMDNTSADFVIDGENYGIEVGGMYNVYNALAAASVAEYYQVAPEKIRAGLAYDEKVFGRQEAFAEMNLPAVIAGGERHEDMALRLKVAGIPSDKLTEVKELDDVIAAIPQLPTDHVYILATYTAVLQLRKKLAEKGYIKGGMDRG